uniref:glycosyltransferase n=4 Tax=Enterobacteriaceae TaxID=543 RepID=UPI0025A6678A
MFDDFYVQSVLMPSKSLKANERSYINLENAYCDIISGSIIFGLNGYASFDTYYNSISLSVWNDLCDIGALQLSLRGTGSFFIQQVFKNESNDEIILESCHMQLSPDIDSKLPIIKFSELPKKGLLFFKVWATKDECKLMSGKWSSLLAPRQDVKLGIVITHFNRKQYVLPSLQRISEQLLTDQFYKDRIDFAVIDNSQNITQEESCGITIIPNENLGGSGGFTRGLKYFHERGDITHVLFMDDDASCEIDSIKRAYSILRFSKEEDTAISGALLREDITYSLIEQGATFDRVCRPSHHGKDVRLTSTLLDIEYSDAVNGYGAWWFFAFPLSLVTSYPFPFFVRGDDVLFGMMNSFNIISPMGICCYGEDFSTKVSALTRYLDFRSGYVNMLYHNESALKIIRSYINLSLSVLFSAQY